MRNNRKVLCVLLGMAVFAVVQGCSFFLATEKVTAVTYGTPYADVAYLTQL